MSEMRDTFVDLFNGSLAACADPDNVVTAAAVTDAAMAEVEKRFPSGPLADQPIASWTHLEILGHREHDALVSDEVRRGQEGVRVRLLCPLGHVVLDRWYRASAIYSEERDSNAEVRGLAYAAATCQHSDCEAERKAKEAQARALVGRRHEVSDALAKLARSLGTNADPGSSTYACPGSIYDALRFVTDLPSDEDIARLGALLSPPAPAADWVLYAERWPELVRVLQEAIPASSPE